MRPARFLVCGLIFTLAALISAPVLFAAGLDRAQPAGGEIEPTAEEKWAFCNLQRGICLDVCRLYFRDSRSCTQSCRNLVPSCAVSGCYNWLNVHVRFAANHGGQQCIQ